MRNHKLHRRFVGVLAAVGVEVVVQQDGDFARNHARIRGLGGHHRLVGLQVFEEIDGGVKVLVIAPQGQVHGHHTDLTHRSAGWVEVTDHAFVLGVGQVFP